MGWFGAAGTSLGNLLCDFQSVIYLWHRGFPDDETEVGVVEVRGGIGERGEWRAFGHRAKVRCYEGGEGVKGEGLRVKGKGCVGRDGRVGFDLLS